MPLHHDLHTHSLASDGTLSPRELVVAARAAGVDVLALTDHDTLDGLDEAQSAADAQGLRLVPGVEISVTWSKLTIHVLGLQVNRACPELRAGLQGLQAFRDWRAEEMGRRLAKAGIEGGFERARELAQGRIISRTHFARFLVEQGRAASIRDVFKHYLVNKKPVMYPVNGPAWRMPWAGSAPPAVCRCWRIRRVTGSRPVSCGV